MWLDAPSGTPWGCRPPCPTYLLWQVPDLLRQVLNHLGSFMAERLSLLANFPTEGRQLISPVCVHDTLNQFIRASLHGICNSSCDIPEAEKRIWASARIREVRGTSGANCATGEGQLLVVRHSKATHADVLAFEPCC